VLDTSRWGPMVPMASDRVTQVTTALSGNSWCVTAARPDQSPTVVWQRLGALIQHGPATNTLSRTSGMAAHPAVGAGS
jgi:hypothetical protein